MRRIGLLCLALVLALGTMGIGHALWSDWLYVDGTVATGEVSWEFICGSILNGDPCDTPTIDKQCGDGFMNPWPESTGKDVGCTEVECVDSDGDGDIDTLVVTIHNAYPGYYVHIAWMAHNNGTIPIHFERAFIGSGAVEEEFTGIPCLVSFDAFEIRFGNNFGAQLHYCESIDQSFDVHVKQAAEQGATYTFYIRLQAVQYNESIHP